MRPTWKGYLTFGLVTIPVRLYTATDSQDVHFRLLHKSCGTPIKNRRWCPTHEAEVSADELVRAFEYERGRFVTMTDEELERVPLEGAHTVNISQFSDVVEIDPILFERSYYLRPDEGGGKAYRLLSEAMQETGKVAVGKVVLREKEHLVAVRPHKDGLLLSMLFYADEVRQLDEADKGPVEARVHPNERKMAVQLVEGLSAAFNPAEFGDEYREQLMKVVKAKVEGQAVVAAPAQKPAKVIDLMDALRRSLEMTKKGKPAAERTRRVAASRARRTG